jgi:Ca2+-binding RTX toxin-like protein
MTTTVTVPGAADTAIPNNYSTPYNVQVAQQISSLLFDAQDAGTLYVVNAPPTPGPVPAGETGEIAVTLPGATNIVVPAAYTYTALAESVLGPITISGGGSLFAGAQNTTYYGAAAPGTVLVTAGNGNDLIALPAGSAYNVALGNGNDTVYADGSGTVSGGTGANLIFADSPGGQNTVNSLGAADTIVAGAGWVTVNSYGSNPLVFGGSGQLVYLGGSAGSPTIAGGSGSATLFGGAGQNLIYTQGTDTLPGSDILAAGAGNETLNAGAAANGVQLAAGIGSVDLIGTTGNDTFYGGAGAATMTGNGGQDNFLFGNTPGHTGGVDVITDFNTSDTFVLAGYGANAAQAALNAATVAGGNTTVRLPDNTTITFLNVTNPNSIHSQSF